MWQSRVNHETKTHADDTNVGIFRSFKHNGSSFKKSVAQRTHTEATYIFSDAHLQAYI